jgi:hypothetical protein
MELRIVAMALLLFLAVFFLGVGITGFAVFSETCCDQLDKNCEPSNACVRYSEDNTTMNLMNTFAGIGLVAAAALVYKYGKPKKKKR